MVSSGAEDNEEQLFSMAEFRKKQREKARQEVWKYFEEKIKIEKKKYYDFWRRRYFIKSI